jgi:phage terminase large subunit-like protein
MISIDKMWVLWYNCRLMTSSENSPIFKQTFLDWLDDPEKGFYVANTWDATKDVMGGRGRLSLFPHQRRILGHVLDFDPETGRFPYTTVIISKPKKSGKTAENAAVGAWFAENAPPDTEIYVVANDLEQASSRVLHDIQLHVKLREITDPLKYIIKYPGTETKIEALSKSYRSSAGSRHALTLWDELWGYSSEDSRRLWDELQPIPTVPYSLRFITTYAGFYGESDLLWDLYLAGVGTDEHPNGKGKRVKGLEDLPCWSNGRLFVCWDHEPRMPWQDATYYEEMRKSERPASYLRLHENRWVTSHEAFMPIEWWDKAAEKYEQSADIWMEHPYRRYPVYVAVDAGIKHDCTAVMGVTFDASKGKLILLFHKIWKPLKDQPLDLEETLEPYLRRVWKQYNVKEIAFDPSQLLQMKKRLEKDSIKMFEFTQTGRDMTTASQNLFDLFQGKNFWAYPDEEIRAHLRNSIAEQTSAGLRIVKDRSNRRMEEKKVDAAVALAMACYRAVECTRAVPDEPIVIEAPFSDLAEKREDPLQKNLPFPLRSD